MGKTNFLHTFFRNQLPPDFREAPDGSTSDILRLKPFIYPVGPSSVFKITLYDTPGYGETTSILNNWSAILSFMEEQFRNSVERSQMNTKVDCVFYLMRPNRCCPADVSFMRLLSKLTVVIPFVAKSDSIDPEEKEEFLTKAFFDLSQPNENGETVIGEDHPF